jgi:2-isopropylmalate synthase
VNKKSTYDVKKVLVLDTTLREGEQSVGLCFSIAEKIELVNRLKDFGIKLIEIGHPGISKKEEQICKTICESFSGVDFLVHARACEEDIIAAKNSNAQWVGIWASYNDISLASKFNNKSREWIKTQVYEAVTLAKQFGLKVRFTIEDASRTDFNLIHELGSIAVKAKADRISLADTVGAWHPKECYKAIEFAVKSFDCEIEVHLHNDLGLANGNAMAAIDAGASVIDASILGVGERAGICDLFSLCAALEQFYGIEDFNFKSSLHLSQFVSRIGAFTLEPHHPIVGQDAFTHASKYHIDAMVNNNNAYEYLIPENFGRKSCNILSALDRKQQQRFLNTLSVKKPFIKGASELSYHRDGVGKRWVFMDNRVDERSSVYIIERIFDKDYTNEYKAHVDSHAHNCDSVFVFMGNNDDGSGLSATVTFTYDGYDKTEVVHAPASILIPARVLHSYAYLSGTGRFLNFVLSPSYNESLVRSHCQL